MNGPRLEIGSHNGLRFDDLGAGHYIPMSLKGLFGAGYYQPGAIKSGAVHFGLGLRVADALRGDTRARVWPPRPSRTRGPQSPKNRRSAGGPLSRYPPI
jgi:hypothetical protein